MDRKQILSTLVRIIYHISDKEYQNRVWIEAEEPEADDFDETACHFFQEGNGILDHYEEFEISQSQYVKLKKFRDAFKAFCDIDKYYLPEEFINSPEWTKITKQAKKLLIMFNYSK